MTEGTALRFKHWTIITLFSLLLLLLLSAGTVYVVDPFEHYRQASFYTPLYDNQVYCNSGIARHYDYDAVLLGSSMVENTRASSLDEHFGVRSVKLPFKGGLSLQLRPGDGFGLRKPFDGGGLLLPGRPQLCDAVRPSLQPAA